MDFDKYGSLKQQSVGRHDAPLRQTITYSLIRYIFYYSGVTVQLVEGGEYYGRVQINYDDQIGTVCDNSWSSSDARVVCKQLGFADGDPISGSYYGGGTGSVMMDGLGCYGYEDSLLECRNKGWLTTPKMSCHIQFLSDHHS
jgi:hypothetical protein